MNSYRRLLKEVQECKERPIEGITLGPHADNLFEWDVVLNGPIDSPYEGGIFELKLHVPSSFPMEPPKVQFVTKICHPNIHFKTGEVCLDILKTDWSPTWTLTTTCSAVSLLLSYPEPSSPLNCDAGNLLRCGDQRGYKSLAKMYTRMYATKN